MFLNFPTAPHHGSRSHDKQTIGKMSDKSRFRFHSPEDKRRQPDHPVGIFGTMDPSSDDDCLPERLTMPLIVDELKDVKEK
jgi:hypothetical protein